MASLQRRLSGFILGSVVAAGALTGGFASGDDARGAGGAAAAAALSEDEFERLHDLLRIESQPWAALPWKISVTEARRVSAETGKPVFMQVNTGNCLGFV